MLENDEVYVITTQIENVDTHVHLVQRYGHQRQNQDKNIQIRITAGWTAFFKGDIAICWKKQAFNSCLLPAMKHAIVRPL